MSDTLPPEESNATSTTTTGRLQQRQQSPHNTTADTAPASAAAAVSLQQLLASDASSKCLAHFFFLSDVFVDGITRRKSFFDVSARVATEALHAALSVEQDEGTASLQSLLGTRQPSPPSPQADAQSSSSRPPTTSTPVPNASNSSGAAAVVPLLIQRYQQAQETFHRAGERFFAQWQTDTTILRQTLLASMAAEEERWGEAERSRMASLRDWQAEKAAEISSFEAETRQDVLSMKQELRMIAEALHSATTQCTVWREKCETLLTERNFWMEQMTAERREFEDTKKHLMAFADRQRSEAQNDQQFTAENAVREAEARHQQQLKDCQESYERQNKELEHRYISKLMEQKQHAESWQSQLSKKDEEIAALQREVNATKEQLAKSLGAYEAWMQTQSMELQQARVESLCDTLTSMQQFKKRVLQQHNELPLAAINNNNSSSVAATPRTRSITPQQQPQPSESKSLSASPSHQVPPISYSAISLRSDTVSSSTAAAAPPPITRDDRLFRVIQQTTNSAVATPRSPSTSAAAASPHLYSSTNPHHAAFGSPLLSIAAPFRERSVSPNARQASSRSASHAAPPQYNPVNSRESGERLKSPNGLMVPGSRSVVVSQSPSIATTPRTARGGVADTLVAARGAFSPSYAARHVPSAAFTRMANSIH